MTRQLDAELYRAGDFLRKLTLISAPAGYGKTTLAEEWLHDLSTLDANLAQDRCVAWLSLAEGDNDPALFLKYILAAFCRVQAGFGAAQEAMFSSPQPPPQPMVMTALVNELASLPSPVILVLDDYHVIQTPNIHQLVGFMLDNLPPQVHLVLLTSEDPLLPIPRLRVRIAMGIFLSALSGVMLLPSFPSYGLWPLAWIACVPYRFAQHRLLPFKRSKLAEATAMLVFLGPFMAGIFGKEFGPFFYLLGVLIAILTYFIGSDRPFHEKTAYCWFILYGTFSWVGFEMIRATVVPLVATSAFICYTQSTQPWITRPVSIISVFGLNLLIMLVNYALALALIAWSDRRWPRGDVIPVPGLRVRNDLLLVSVVIAAWFGTSLVIASTTPQDLPRVRVDAIQPGYSKAAF